MEKISDNFQRVDALNNMNLKDIPMSFNTKDLGVGLNDSDIKAYIKKIAITGDVSGVPDDILQHIYANFLNEIASEKIRHIIIEKLRK